MVKVNSLDERLIKLLKDNARQSSEVLATQLNVSAATIRRRIRRLIKDGVMRIGAIVDPAKIGLPLAAVIALDVTHDSLDSVMQTLAELPEVKWVSTTTGRFDVIVMVRFPDTDELFRFMQTKVAKMEGVRDSEAFVCLHIERDRGVY